jgi:hypothetical protein
MWSWHDIQDLPDALLMMRHGKTVCFGQVAGYVLADIGVAYYICWGRQYKRCAQSSWQPAQASRPSRARAYS